MSISVDESSPAWVKFKDSEAKKFPNFGKVWSDTNGEITGSGRLRSWRWEAQQYLKDRANFIKTLGSVASTQIERPKTLKAPIGEKIVPAPNANKSKSNKVGKPFTAVSSSSKKAQNSTPKMPRRTKRSQAWKKGRGRGRRMQNKALSSVKVPFKITMDVDSSKSSTETGHWHNHLTLAELAGESLKLHEEIKCCSMKVRFIPQDITTGAGLYAACLLDQGGFGDPAKPTTTWFPRVADLPGARLCHITKGCMFTWRPTEPDSRNYRKTYDEKSYVVASFYIFGNATSLSIKGRLLITGLLRGRGEFYSTSLTGKIKALSLFNAPEDGPSDLESLKSLSE